MSNQCQRQNALAPKGDAAKWGNQPLGHNHVSSTCARLGLDNSHDLGRQKSARSFGHDRAHCAVDPAAEAHVPGRNSDISYGRAVRFRAGRFELGWAGS